ncbi:hypothetical protein WG66_000799 [Moniliophthora roreri]|nr:hypothetical protein WG66_000799 [Moniliophthora roreri]
MPKFIQCRLGIKPPRKALLCPGCSGVIYCGGKSARKRIGERDTGNLGKLMKDIMLQYPCFNQSRNRFFGVESKRTAHSISTSFALDLISLDRRVAFEALKASLRCISLQVTSTSQIHVGERSFSREPTIGFYNGKDLLTIQVLGDEDRWRLHPISKPSPDHCHPVLAIEFEGVVD